MRIVGSVLAVLGLLSFAPGVFMYGVRAYYVCFDYCPLDLSGRLGSELLIWVGPGFALTWLAWACFLLLNAQPGRQPQFVVALVALLLSAGIVGALWFGASQGAIIPTQENQTTNWGSFVLFFLLPLAVLCSWQTLRLYVPVFRILLWRRPEPEEGF